MGLVLVCSEVAPGSGLQAWGEVGVSPSPVPVAAGTWTHIQWAVTPSSLLTGGDTQPHS